MKILGLCGPKHCLEENTHIDYTTISSTGDRQSHRGSSIKNLYMRFTGKYSGKGNYLAKQAIDSDIFITSVDDEGKLIRNKIKDVIYCGKKLCFELKTAKGFSVKATSDHMFLTEQGYKQLRDLNTGDNIFIYDYRNRSNENRERQRYKEWFVKYHPSNRIKLIKDSVYKGTYQFYRIPEHHAIVEAAKNNMTPQEYRFALNNNSVEDINTFWTIPEGYSVHHLDENTKNNALENLLLIETLSHCRLHHSQKGKNSHYTSTDIICSITEVGIRETYDIKCAGPFNNFLANRIVSHNCGKDLTLSKLSEHFEVKKVGLADTLKEIVGHVFNIEKPHFENQDLKEIPFKHNLSVDAEQLYTIFTLYAFLTKQLDFQFQPTSNYILNHEIKTPRHLLQFIGTDVLRHAQENIHLKAAQSRFRQDRVNVITDCRFINEVKWVQSLGGKVIYINRPSSEKAAYEATHPSERGVPELRQYCDYVLPNTGTIEELGIFVNELVKGGLI